MLAQFQLQFRPVGDGDIQAHAGHENPVQRLPAIHRFQPRPRRRAQCGAQPCGQRHRLHGLHNVIGGTGGKRGGQAFTFLQRRYDDQGDRRQTRISLDPGSRTDPIHAGQHDIHQDGAHIGCGPVYPVNLQRLQRFLGTSNGLAGAQVGMGDDGRQDDALFLAILDNQDHHHPSPPVPALYAGLDATA